MTLGYVPNIDLDAIEEQLGAPINPLTPEAYEDMLTEQFSVYGDRQFPYVYTARNDDLNTGQSLQNPLSNLSVEMLSARDLMDRFNTDRHAQSAFGTFDNYIGYLDDLLDLAETNPEIAWWEEYGFRNLTGSNLDVANFYDLDEEDGRSGSGERIDAESTNLVNATQAYEAMMANPAVQSLMADRNISGGFNDSGDIYQFNGLGATEVHEAGDTFGHYADMALNAASSILLTSAVGGALGALGGAGGGATAGGFASSAGQNMLATAITQGITTGSVDGSSLVTAGLTGGLEYLAGAAADGLIGASGDVGAAIDNFAWDLADKLGTDVATVYDMANGIAAGTLSGDNLEEIVLGAVGSYSTSQIQDYVMNTYGDQFGDIEVGNLFGDGTTDIDVRAFNPFIETAVGGILGDDVSGQDVLSAIWESGTYEGDNGFDQGGTFEYADPTRGDYEDVLGGWDLITNVNLPDLPDVNLPDFPEVDLPDVPDLPDVNLPDLPEGPDVNLPNVPDAPDVSLPDVDGVDLDLELPAMGAGMMAGAAKPYEGFTSGIDYQRLERPLMPIQTTNDNDKYLNELIARNLGGSLLSTLA